MDRFFNKKHKKTPGPHNPVYPGIPTNTAAGSSGLQEVQGIGPSVTDGMGLQVMDQDQEMTSWTSAPAICGTKRRNQLANEGTGSTEIGERGLTEISSVSKRARKTAERFNPLKVVLGSIPAACANHPRALDVGSKIEGLLSRVVELENQFDSLPSDVAEQRRRDELRGKFEGIGEQLQSLIEMPDLRTEQIYGVLEDLREVVFHYKMVEQREAQNQRCYDIDPADAPVLNNFRGAQGAEYRHGSRNGCLKGTRGFVLDAIERWTGDVTKPPVYWLNGLAGTGKTTIAQTIAERMFADGRLGASFFCSRDYEDRRNLHFIFPTLAVQLARRYPDFRSLFVPLARSDPGIAHDSLYNQMDRLIVRPLKQSNISTVIVIDALDECKDEEPASAILSVLGQFVSDISNVKFFVTGRPEPRIWEGFRLPLLADATDVFVLHEVEPTQVENDIRLFFSHRFTELARRRRGLGGWPTEGQLDLVCERAGGLFVYAVATFKFVDKQNTHPPTQLDLILRSPDSVREGKTKFKKNTTLDSLYTSILLEAFGDDDDADNDPNVRSMFGAMVLAANPLSPSSIARLLGFAVEEVFSLFSSVQSLLILQEDMNSPVRPFHKSFPDFITDPDRCTNPRFHVSPPDHHSQILIACLNLVDLTLEKNMCKLPDGVINSEVTDLKERTKRHIGPALRYGCTSWDTHLVGGRAASAGRFEITYALRRFLERKFLYWLEILSVLGAARIAVGAMQAAVDWLEESYTLDLATDCSRFVIRHFEIISTSSQHIYHSALVLTPRESIVGKLYQSLARPFARVVHGLPAVWESNLATRAHSGGGVAVWSLCSKLIGIHVTCRVDILDATTLQRLQSFGCSPSDEGALAFSPDSRTLTSFVLKEHYPHVQGTVVSWDIQTGGAVSEISQRGPVGCREAKGASIVCSMNGRMVATLSQYESFTSISIYDIVSGVHVHDVHHNTNPIIDLKALHVFKIWTHGESLRFAAPRPEGITIWEVGFAPGGTPMEVETVPIPGDAAQTIIEQRDSHSIATTEFHPASCRLAFIRKHTLLVWDALASRFLLHHPCTDPYQTMTFSSDGSFFACTTGFLEVCLWEESPTGYTLLEKFAPAARYSYPSLSTHGESIVIIGSGNIQLWRTKRFTTPSSGPLVQPPTSTGKGFILEFSPDRSFAVTARKGEQVVTVLDLKAGLPQLTINTSIDVCGLRPIGNTIVVVGDKKAIAWNLPGEDSHPDTRMDIKDSIQTINFGSKYERTEAASISPNNHYIALIRYEPGSYHLEVYCTFTGQHLHRMVGAGLKLWFAPCGHKIWCSNSNEGTVQVFTITQNTLDHTRTFIGYKDESWERPWESSCAYKVAEDGWMVGAGGKRLLMLPPLWRSKRKVDRVWNEKFLALLHEGLPEVVILELEP